MARQYMGLDGVVVNEQGNREYMSLTGVVMQEDQAAAPSGPPLGGLALLGVGRCWYWWLALVGVGV